METTQQIILIILSYSVWIIGGLAILISILYAFIRLFFKFWDMPEKLVLKTLCYLFLFPKNKEKVDVYYNNYRNSWEELLKKEINKEKLSFLKNNKNVFSETDLEFLLNDAITENDKLYKIITKLNNDKIKLSQKIKTLKMEYCEDEDEDEDDF